MLGCREGFYFHTKFRASPDLSCSTLGGTVGSRHGRSSVARGVNVAASGLKGWWVEEVRVAEKLVLLVGWDAMVDDVG
jgi:hypothetical protein